MLLEVGYEHICLAEPFPLRNRLIGGVCLRRGSKTLLTFYKSFWKDSGRKELFIQSWSGPVYAQKTVFGT